MRVISVIIILAALVSPFGCASVYPPIDTSAEDLQTLHTQAALGDAKAQSRLGLMYLDGLGGLPNNLVKAHLWLSMAVTQGNHLSAVERDKVAIKMTPAQIAEAQQLARRCQAQQFKGC